jgi:hypothetical protein
MRMRYIAGALCVLTILVVIPRDVLSTKYAGAFMEVGGGARALGMGGAFVAVAGDASTVYWNPAGMSDLGRRQALAMHSERFGGMVDFNFGAYVQPTGLLPAERKAAFGFALLHLGIEDIIVTNHLGFMDLDSDGVPDFDQGEYLTLNGQRFEDFANLPRESDNSFALLSAFAMDSHFGLVGGALKLIYVDAIAGQTSTGIGIDLGYLCRDAIVEHLDLGVKLQDATGTYLSWSTGRNEFILPVLKLGAAYEVVSSALKGSLLLAFDADLYFENRQTASQLWQGRTSADLHFGGELVFQDRVMVRGGIDAGNPTAGAGLRIGFLGFDYAYLHHDDFEATHRVSALANF